MSAGPEAGVRCGACAHFRNDPAFLERELRGVVSMSSAYASVRADDGLCERHGRYLSAERGCAEFTARAS